MASRNDITSSPLILDKKNLNKYKFVEFTSHTITGKKNKTHFFNGSSVHTCLYKHLPLLD